MSSGESSAPDDSPALTSSDLSPDQGDFPVPAKPPYKHDNLDPTSNQRLTNRIAQALMFLAMLLCFAAAFACAFLAYHQRDLLNSPLTWWGQGRYWGFASGFFLTGVGYLILGSEPKFAFYLKDCFFWILVVGFGLWVIAHLCWGWFATYDKDFCVDQIENPPHLTLAEVDACEENLKEASNPGWKWFLMVGIFAFAVSLPLQFLRIGQLYYQDTYDGFCFDYRTPRACAKAAADMRSDRLWRERRDASGGGPAVRVLDEEEEYALAGWNYR